MDAELNAAETGATTPTTQVTRRVTIHEIFESTEMTKLLKALAQAGVDTAQFAPTEKARYTITENAAPLRLVERSTSRSPGAAVGAAPASTRTNGL